MNNSMRMLPIIALAGLLLGCMPRDGAPLSAASESVANDAALEAHAGPAVYRAVADVRANVRQHGDQLWTGLAAAPFGVLIVTEEGEELLCDDRNPSGFTEVSIEPVTGCSRSLGPTSWRNPGLLAAMPAFGPPSVVVIGTPEATGLSPLDWQATLAHEHFHQWQSALPDYYARVEALDLSGGDETGMWMLNYPFPYSAPEVADKFAATSRALHTALEAPDADLAEAAGDYMAARGELRRSVTEAQWRYFEFQLWQEGVARWTEYRMAQLDGRAEMRSVAQNIRSRSMRELTDPQLARFERVSLYAIGFGEAELLERANAQWRNNYSRHLAMGPLLRDAFNR